MQFKNPEFLYFLFLLVIPVIVHFFQLRKFRKTPFTNVAFLKKVKLQTRKSSRIKKWLTLFARMLALACLVIAFAQPFIPGSKTATIPTQTVIYLDNSFSMQLKGKRGELLKRSVHELLEGLPSDKQFTLLTNNNTYRNTTIQEIKNLLLSMEYSPVSPSFKNMLLRAKNEFNKNRDSNKQLIVISDFQQNTVNNDKFDTDSLNLNLVQVSPVNTSNVAIDSLYISNETLENIELTVLLSYSGTQPDIIPISLYDSELVIAKTGVDFKKGTETSVELSLRKTNKKVEGKVVIEDRGLRYDNTLYFSINPPEKINVIALGTSKDRFLKRIFDSKRFDFTAFPTGKFNYSLLTDANTIILNGLNKIPSNLVPALKKLVQNGGHLAIVPGDDIQLDSYNNLLLNLNAPTYSEKIDNKKNITEINFSHPLFRGVFEGKVDNFQYPETKMYYQMQGSGNPVLKYADGSAFLIQNKNVYLFSSSLDLKTSNFKNSPLVVPVFYNIALQSLQAPKLYYTTGRKATYAVQTKLEKDRVLSIENENSSFIPQQQSFTNKVKITTSLLPKTAETYNIVKNGTTLKKVSYNYDRSESELQYFDISQVNGLAISHDLKNLLEEQKQNLEITELWKWFVIFAVFFLIVEVALLRFLK